LIDTRKRTVVALGKSLTLSSTEFEMLVYLAKRAGQVIHRDQLLEHLRGSECDAYNRSVDTLISRLRTKLGDDPHAPKFIKTVWGSGYVFVAGDDTK
jgi:DNA-binding response OmpR family regulator